MKGEEKSRVQKQCFYGPDGKVQKQQLSAPPPEATPDGVKGKIAAKKKAEITADHEAGRRRWCSRTCRQIRSESRP